MIDLPLLSVDPHFATFSFWVIFACIYAVFLVMRKNLHTRNIFLLLVSYLFYVLWDVRFLFVVLLSTAIGFAMGLLLERTTKNRGVLLTLGILLQMSILLYCKYAGFFVDSANQLMSLAGLRGDWVMTQLLLPLGLSFYTFQILSYLIDVYRRKQQATSSIVEFGLYVAFFPKMLAGPIERASHFLPQTRSVPLLTSATFSEGCSLIAWGLVQKIVIADNAAYIARMSLVTPDVFHIHTISALLALSLQIYGDFAGYSDCARGIAKLLGFDLVKNFNMPYAATSLRDFWRRWHISLSDWCRDYIYIPLGGNREGTVRTFCNLFITMVLVGLWHGPRFGYLLWGAYHGVLLGLNHTLLRTNAAQSNILRNVLGAIVTFSLVSFGWLFFQDITTYPLYEYIGQMSVFQSDAFLPYVLLLALPIICMHILEWKTKSAEPVARAPLSMQLVFYYLCFYGLILLQPTFPTAFLYTRF